MKGFLAVARRNILERRSVLAAAILGSLVPFVVPLGRGMSGVQAQEARTWTAFILSSAFLVALTAGLGATILPSRIADRRISFDLSRPISSWSLWLGTVSSALLLALASAALVWLPSGMAGSEIPWRDLLVVVPAPWPLFLIAAIPVFFALCYGVSIALRSRSALLLVDAFFLAGAGLATALIARLLLRHEAREVLQTGLRALSVAISVLLVAAGGISVARGRADIRRAHRAYSATLWAGVMVSLLLLGAWTSWVLSAGPADLSHLSFVDPAPSGSWMTLEGRARHADAMFLFHETTGRGIRVPHTNDLAFSEDGSRAAWLDSAGNLMTVRLDEPSSSPARTGVSAGTRYAALTLSSDGTRAAIAVGGIVTVYAVASGQALASARVAGRGDFVRMLFVDGERVRVYAWAGTQTEPAATRVRILELDARARRLGRTGSFETRGGWPWFVIDPGRARLLLRDKTSTRILDARSGALLALVAESEPGERGLHAFLADGRIALATVRSDGNRLTFFRLDGSLARSIELPPTERVGLGGEVAPGTMVVGLRKSDDWRSGDVFLVDAETGKVKKIAERLWPVVGLARYWDPLAPPERPGSPATQLFFGPHSSLVRFNPLTAERQTILAGEMDWD